MKNNSYKMQNTKKEFLISKTKNEKEFLICGKHFKGMIKNSD